MSKLMLDKDCQRFFRAGILILKHGTALLQTVLDLVLQQKHVSLRELLSQYRHELFHSWQKNGCCFCPTHKASYFSGYLLKSQYEDMFTLVASRECQHIKTSVHGLCSCRYDVRSDVYSRSLDIIVLSMLLLNLDVFRLDDDVKDAISELRRLRNEIISKATVINLSEADFILLWNRAVPSVTKIAHVISNRQSKQISEIIRALRDDPLHLYSAMVVITTVRHGNQREMSLLKDLEHVRDIFNSKRQGELLPMLDMGLEVVCSTFGQSDPALKEIQNSKFLLHEGKITDLNKKLCSSWMRKLSNTRQLVNEQTEIWREQLWASDPLRFKTSADLGFISCGDNIHTSNDRRSAVWEFAESEGVTFSNRPMGHLEHILIDVTGSGEVALGVIESDPVLHRQKLSSFSTFPELKTSIVVKTFDSSNRVKISRDSGQLLFFCDGQRYVLDTDYGSKPWLVFYLRFGDVEIELQSNTTNPMKFHDVMGENVQATGGQKRLLSLKRGNSRSVCRLNRRLHCGEEVTLCIKQVKPVDVRAIPSYLILGVSADGLQNGSLHDDLPFSSASRSWLLLKNFDEKLCAGKIHLSISFSGVLTFVSSRGINEIVKLSKSEKKMGVAIVFELFRTELEIASYKIKR